MTLLATAGLQSAAATALQATLDAHWRGAYDILVTSKKAASDDLMSPNALISDDDRMPLDLLARIRGIDGVAVAAPISQLVVPSSNFGQISLAAPVDTSKHELDPQRYRLRVQYLTDDGLGQRLAFARTYRLTLDQTDAPRDIAVDRSAYDDSSGCTTQVGDINVDCTYVYPETEPRFTAVVQPESPDLVHMGSNMSNSLVDGEVQVPIPSIALPPSRITLVDPVAEQALLGGGGGFLDPLVGVGPGAPRSIDEISDWMATQPTTDFSATVTAAAQQQQASVDGFEASDLYRKYVAEKVKRGETPQPVEDVYPAGRYLPVIVAPTTDVPLTVRIEVEGMGPGTMPDIAAMGWTDPTIDDADVAGVPLGTISADARQLLDPFSTQAFTMPWLGSTSATPENGPSGFIGGWFGQAARSSPARPTMKDGVRTLESTGYLGNDVQDYWGGDPSVWVKRGLGTATGSQSTYSDVQTEQVVQDFDGGGSSFLPVGGFDADDLVAAEDPLSYVPLGAYDPAGMTLVADASGAATGPTELKPLAGGLGLVGARTTAIADIAAVSSALQTPTMDAVRVRVAGVDRYDGAGIAAVGAVADEIEKLGLSATIVAGSSPQTVRMAVDGYAFGTTDAAGVQKVGALGTVEQQWSALGAAAKLGTSVSQATLALLATVLAATLALFAVGSLSGRGTRRSESATLRTVGWTRGRIMRWLLAEQWPAVVAVLLAGGLAVLLAADDALVLSTTASVVLGVLVIAVLRAVTGSNGQRVRLATSDELHRDHPADRPEVRWTSAPAAEIHGGYGLPSEVPDVHQAPDATAGVADGTQRVGRRTRRLRLGAESLVGFGLRLVRGHVGGSIGNAAAVLIVMAMTACFVLSIDLGRTAAGASLLAQFGTAQALAPQVLLGLVGVATGALLTVLVKAQTLQRRSRARAVLRELGWVGSDIRRAERAEVLYVGVPAALLGCYLLWFSLDAAGLDGIDTAVSAALVSGLAVVGILLATTRKATPTP